MGPERACWSALSRWVSPDHRFHQCKLYLTPYSFVLVSGSGILGVSIALNALSTHAACTVWWSFIATVVVVVVASIRTFQNIGWLTWAGFASLFTAILMVV